MFKTRFISMLVLLAAVATGAWATLPETVYYREYAYGDSKLTYEDHSIASTDATEVTSSTTEWENGTYVVTATTTISSRITVTGTVNLIIFDGATLTAEKGITVSDGNTLNIYMGNSSNSIQSTGQLNATAVEGRDYSAYPDDYEVRGAGIGGYLVLDEMAGSPIIEKLDCGNVNIHGGKINVQNESTCVAGIGGSEYGAGGNITIYYSQVTAYGDEYVSAIGAGNYGSGGTVAIYGGDVNAIVTNVYNTTTPGIGASLTVGKDVQVYALLGSKSADEDLSDDTNVAPEGGGQVTTFNNSMFTRYTGPAPAPPVTAVTLTDGNDLSGLSAYAGQTVDVTYTRSFTAGKTSTVCLPFAYTKKAGDGSFYAFTNIEKVGNEYVATMTEPGESTLTANTPYLYMPNATGSVDFGGAYTIPADLTAGSTTSNGWTFKGTYEAITWTAAPTGTYGFSGANYSEQGIYQGQFVKVGENVSIKPMRCYLENASFAGARGINRTTSADEQLPETIKVRLVSASGKVTAIGSLQTKTGKVKLDGDAWYTLDGRHMEGKPGAKGIYINNNKKVIVK